MRKAAPALAMALYAVVGVSSASADGPSDPELDRMLSVLATQKLSARAASDVSELSALVIDAEKDAANDRHELAVARLSEALLGPRFRDFDTLAEFRDAELALARSLFALGALKSAQRYAESIVARGPKEPLFGPALELSVDAALAAGDADAAYARLEPWAKQSPTGPSELAYLKGRTAFVRHDDATAKLELSQIKRTSRFFANAQYLLGVLEARGGRYPQAEAHLCTIANAGRNDRYSFFIDERFFEVQDLARLALGRIAHEGKRPKDAYYYYFQVPNDSARLPEALLESAYASYEGGDHDAALDALEQLDARFAGSRLAAEGQLLRGYVHLGRCEFVEAETALQAFEKSYRPVVRDIDALLGSEPRFRRFIGEWTRDAASTDPAGKRVRPLVSDNEALRDLVVRSQRLFAAAVRAGTTPTQLSALQMELAKRSAPRARIDDAADARKSSLEERIEAASIALSMHADELGRIGASTKDTSELRKEWQALRKLENKLTDLRFAVRSASLTAPDASQAVADSPVATLLTEEAERALALEGRASALAAKLEERAADAARQELLALRDKLKAQLRRARIGRVDAVMGAKRRLELQVESLAAGRFPPELIDPLRVQGLLRDDEEYWPFQGEEWQDEAVERSTSEPSP